jgi:hypothetical protein
MAAIGHMPLPLNIRSEKKEYRRRRNGTVNLKVAPIKAAEAAGGGKAGVRVLSFLQRGGAKVVSRILASSTDADEDSAKLHTGGALQRQEEEEEEEEAGLWEAARVYALPKASSAISARSSTSSISSVNSSFNNNSQQDKNRKTATNLTGSISFEVQDLT